jgi:hypothetical protein
VRGATIIDRTRGVSRVVRGAVRRYAAVRAKATEIRGDFADTVPAVQVTPFSFVIIIGDLLSCDR